MSWTGGKAAREDRTGIPSPGSRQAMEATGAEGDVSADSRLKGVQVALQNVREEADNGEISLKSLESVVLKQGERSGQAEL